MLDSEKIKILYLCTGNSCRSQMAEGLTRHLKGNEILAHSAGIEPVDIDHLAVKVMDEISIDISFQYSKHVDIFKNIEFDYIIFICKHAYENCPVFHEGKNIIHMGFDDPSKLAELTIDEEDALFFYRNVRDEIKFFVESLPDSIDDKLNIQ